MRLNDVITEEHLDELNLNSLKAGVTGAVSGYKASQSQRKGAEHSKRIVANLKANFMQTVGGGHTATYKNLRDFLADQGLIYLDKIPMPNSNVGVDSPVPSKKVEPSSPERIEPTLDPISEDTEAELSNDQIDKIISAAVRLNYNRIRLAQQGRLPAEEQPDAEPEPTTADTGANVMGSMASQLTKQSPKTTASTAPASTTPEPAATAEPSKPEISGEQPSQLVDINQIKTAYEKMTPEERAQLKSELEIIDDHDRLASGTNESRKRNTRSVLEFQSKFLRTTI